ncbi:MAG TPA: D-alanyl-D-alanine carboxypeptidase/D-alanyl-D-alanine-endopeptidase [Kiloniellales bacterium]|nr:D-alanyl-D-alanine carboxypeptidase/D-alanyl-D-alanine-endopeptidase [Kiloniellales bacterium]
MRFVHALLISLALFALAFPARADGTATQPTLAAPTSLLPQRLAPPDCPCEAELIAAQGFPFEQVGYIVFDLSTGAIVASQNADQGFIPASVQKLPTMVAALSLLGSEYQFKTALWSTAPIRKGVLKGDLYLEGGGDPFLTTDDLLNLVLALKDQGLKTVEGGFYFDETALPKLSELNPTQPVAVPYNPGLSALNVNFNIVEVKWWREPSTGDIVGSARSRSDTLDVVAEAISFAPQPEVISKRMPVLLDYATLAATGEEKWLLSPGLPKKGAMRLPVKEAGMNAAMVFRKIAADQGILLAEPQAKPVPAGSHILKRHESVPLDLAAQLILRYSNNLAAELVGLTAAKQIGPAGSLAQASAALTAWLQQQIPTTDWTGFRTDTNSGLSANARMTARQAMGILSYAWSLRFAGLDIYALLPKVKWNEELNELYEETVAEGSEPATGGLEVRAKSGTIYWSRGLAGYIQSSQGRMLGFALFVGDLAQRAAYDATLNVDELVGEPGARDWTKRAKALEQALISRWATGY